MRRLTRATLCGIVVLAAACSDQTQAPTEPTAPSPEANFESCRVARFPIQTVFGLIKEVFPPGRPRGKALAQAAAVALLWDTCRPTAARQLAVVFVNWIDRNAPSNASPDKVIALKVAILNGVGVPVPLPSGSSDDFGVGIFDPNNPNKTLIKTKSGRALVELEPGSFLEPTVISISRKADDFSLTNFEGRQFPPKYDYDAVNTSGDKVLESGKKAIVAFCLLSLDDEEFPGGEGFPPGYPEHPRIGHNPVSGAPGFPFEVLEEVNLAAAGLDDDLSEDVCGHSSPTPSPRIGPFGRFGGGLPGFAKAALRQLLPPPLWAATALGPLPPPPPIGGRAPSLSPFGVVEFVENELQISEGTDPGGGDLESGTPLGSSCIGDCTFPEVRLVDADGVGVEGVLVTATLLRLEGESTVEDTFAEGSTTSVFTETGEGAGSATFNNLIVVAFEGDANYKIRFSAPGATSVTTGPFRVRDF